MNELLDFLRRLPKTETHLHLEACMSGDILYRLFLKNGFVSSREELQRKLDFKNLREFIELFFLIQDSIKTENDLNFMTEGLEEYLVQNNIRYAEVFFTPSRFLQKGLDFQKMMEVIAEDIHGIEQRHNIIVRILVDVSRSFGSENAARNLEHVIRTGYPEIIGIGLGGDEKKGPARDYITIFDKARSHGLHTVAHAGEDVGPESVWATINLLKAERIGHGTSVMNDDTLIRHLNESQLPVEICPTSNVITGAFVTDISDHPIGKFYRGGMNVTLHSDDPAIFNVSISHEYLNVITHHHFTMEDTFQLIKNGVFSTFHPDKHALWQGIESELQQYRNQTLTMV